MSRPQRPVRIAVRPAETSRRPAPPPAPSGPPARGGNIGMLPFSTSSYTEKTIRDQQAQSVAEAMTNSEPAVHAAIGNTNRYEIDV